MAYIHETPVVTGEVVSAPAFALTEQMSAAAQYVAEAPEFNHYRAEMVMRGLTYLARNMDGATLAGLSTHAQQKLCDTAAESYALVDPEVVERAQAAMAEARPATQGDAMTLLFSEGYTLLQRAVYNGPDVANGGYDPANEEQMRGMVTAYADTFNTVYRELDAAGHPLAADPYFESSLVGVMPPQTEPDAPFYTDVEI